MCILSTVTLHLKLGQEKAQKQRKGFGLELSCKVEKEKMCYFFRVIDGNVLTVLGASKQKGLLRGRKIGKKSPVGCCYIL